MVRVLRVSGDFGCDIRIICKDFAELINHLQSTAEQSFKESEIGDRITIEIAEMEQEKLDNLPESDGC